MDMPVKTLSPPRGGGSYGLPLQEGSPLPVYGSGRTHGLKRRAKAVRIQNSSPRFFFSCQNPILHPVAHYRESEEMSYSNQGVRGAGEI